MKKLSVLILLFTFNFCLSQFAIINHKDGFVNVRSSAEKTNNILDKLENSFVVYCFEPKGNWINIDYTKNGKYLNGYIYKDRIKYITDFKKIALKSVRNGIAKLENDSVILEISETDFVKTKHQLKFHNNNLTQLNTIDNLHFFGTDGDIPKREYKSIKVVINNVILELPNSALKNLYEPSLFNSKANYDEANDILYIHSSNSDGAGGYEIIWIIEKKKFKSRIEAYGF